MARVVRGILRAARIVLMCVGVIAILGLGSAFTSRPWRVYRWLATDSHILDEPPEFIVVLGGGGIPSESGLMRTYQAADAGHAFIRAKVIVALPADECEGPSSPEKMKRELVMRGIQRGRIRFEDKGRNTREQALLVREMLAMDDHEPTVLIVTSPEHMKRSLLAFRKAGFTRVSGSPAFNESVETDLAYDGKDLGGRQAPILSVGRKQALRYDFWNNLQYMVWSGREVAALAYYWLRGWI